MTDANYSLIRARLPYDTMDGFIEGYARFISAGGMFMPMAETKLEPIGTSIRFQLILQDNSTALLGEGVVLQNRPPDATNPRSPVGMLVKFTRLSQESKHLVDRVVAEKQAQSESAPVEMLEADGDFAGADDHTPMPGDGEAEDDTHEISLQDFLDKESGRPKDEQVVADPPTAEAPEPATVEAHLVMGEHRAADPSGSADAAEPATGGPRKLAGTEGGVQVLAFDNMSEEELAEFEGFSFGGDEDDIDGMFDGLFGGSGDDDGDDDSIFGEMFGGGGEAADGEDDAADAGGAFEEVGAFEDAPSLQADASEEDEAFAEDGSFDEPDEFEEPDFSEAAAESSAAERLEEDEEDEEAPADEHEEEQLFELSEPAPEAGEEAAEEAALELEEPVDASDEIGEIGEIGDVGEADQSDEVELVLDEALDEEEIEDERLVDEALDGLLGSGREGAPADASDDFLGEESSVLELGGDDSAIELADDISFIEEESEAGPTSAGPPSPPPAAALSSEMPAAGSDEMSAEESSVVEDDEAGADGSSAAESADDVQPFEGTSELDDLLGHIDDAPGSSDEKFSLRLGGAEPDSFVGAGDEISEDDDDEESLEALLASAQKDIESKRGDEEAEGNKDILDELLGDDDLPPPPSDVPSFELPRENRDKKKKGFISKLFNKD